MKERVLENCRETSTRYFIDREKEIANMLRTFVEEKLEGKFDLDELENTTTGVLQRLRKQVTETIMEAKDVKGKDCPRCGGGMKIKDKVSRNIQGLVNYQFCRRIFHCEGCRIYEKPLDDEIGCHRKEWGQPLNSE